MFPESSRKLDIILKSQFFPYPQIRILHPLAVMTEFNLASPNNSSMISTFSWVLLTLIWQPFQSSQTQSSKPALGKTGHPVGQEKDTFWSFSWKESRTYPTLELCDSFARCKGSQSPAMELKTTGSIARNLHQRLVKMHLNGLQSVCNIVIFLNTKIVLISALLQFAVYSTSMYICVILNKDLRKE